MGNLADSLYIELVATAIILMLISLYNNIVLYKIKLNDLLTLIVIFTIIVCIADIVIDQVQGKAGMQWLTYMAECTSTVASVAVGAIFLRFVMIRLGFDITRKWQKIILFYIPNLFLFILCVTTPWTSLIYYIDGNNMIHSMQLYYLYVYLLAAYTSAGLIIAIVVLLRSLNKNEEKKHAAVTTVIFAGLVFFLQLIQAVYLGFESDYISIGLAWAVSLVYLTTNMNMDTLVENRTRAAAVKADLDIASKIQSDALPKVFPPYEHHPEIELYAAMDTAKEVGGDFYDCFEIDERRVCFVMADVSGKGVPASLFMMTAKTMIKDYAMLKGSTAEIFTEVNKYLSENNETGMFATAWIGIIDTEDMTLQYTNAGHNYPYIAHSGGDFTELKKKHGLFLAGMDDTEYRESEIQLKEGDSLFLYTDGLTEAHNIDDELYDTTRLKELLNSASDRSGKALLPEIKRSVDEFAGGREQFDDITMMIINIKC
ncbi:MAG: serine/threonine-protein phosphatase [Clostridia bacterium]|nr:serine/threonine-protein phosphatase [Clostridia bacterium]